MLSVTFSQPIHIDAANLHSLLSLANAPATVEPYLNGHAVEAVPAPKRVRKSAASSEAAPPAGDRPKRTRATKAEMAARKAAAAPQDTAPAAETTATPEAAAVVDAPTKKPGRKPKADAPKAAVTHTSEALMERFAKLIDADFAKASGLLEGFGVKRFSELKDSEYGAFDGKLTELGV